ncbi:glutamate receptor ionotropic, kainate 2-like [Tubulanus polymorphus]|uniref:glutamate receptor ionotropic, kainate 2-like n=1 Tax=Tubulanus polymorphus TaxID=672921 RepID=UPI003DA34BF3
MLVRMNVIFGTVILCNLMISLTDGQTAPNTRVVTIVDKLYLIPRDDKSLSGNDKYEGFMKDILDELANEISDLKYNIYLVPDGKYGTKSMVGGKEQWNGMIEEILAKKADIAAAAMTISPDRLKVVDFTESIMSYGVTIMMNKNDAFVVKETPNMTYFFKPFPLITWLLLIVAWILTSILLAIFNRFDPYGWHKRTLRREVTPVTRQGQGFNIYQTLWYTVTGFAMQGGSRWRPISLASRVLSVWWWAFCLITFISYILILILVKPFLSTQSSSAKVSSDSALFKSNLEYGVIESSRTYNFLKNSNNPVHQKMLPKLKFLNSTEEGHELVKQGGFAFIGMSPYLERISRKDKDLVLIGGLLNKGQYGLALPKNSPMKSKLNSAITKMKASGKLEELYNKWWKKEDVKEADEEIDESKLPDTRGIFIMLAIGMAVALLVLLAEILFFKFHGKKSRGNLNTNSHPDDSMMVPLETASK